ncbi:MAG: hypothetical protein PUC65_00760 [Clostridiales bacterium]|nr:hypothetical protein [Clostridiales bacterium]
MVAIFLCACSSVSTTYTVEEDGINFVVDTINGTISDGEYTYQYSFSGSDSSYRVDITYPNNSSYWWQQQGASGYGGWSDAYDENRYVAGDVLRDVLEHEAPKESNTGSFLMAIILLVVGIFNISSPRTAWYLEYGWRYKNAEPSDFALIMNRISGGVLIVIAIILFIV